MASETMESAIMIEVASIRRMVEENLPEITISSVPKQTIGQFIFTRLDAIEGILHEGNPEPLEDDTAEIQDARG